MPILFLKTFEEGFFFKYKEQNQNQGGTSCDAQLPQGEFICGANL